MTTYDDNIAQQCAARTICSGHPSRSDSPLCAPTCVAYTELEAQIKASGIPKRYLTISSEPASSQSAAALIRGENPQVAAFIEAWAGDVWQHALDGRGLYLWGRTTGTGKTTVAAALGCDLIRTAVSHSLDIRQALRKQVVYYVHVPSFLRQAKQIYEDDSTVAQEASAAVAVMTDKMTNTALLILDDIGAEKPSEAVRERLLTIIDHRWAESKSTIYTSNLALNELEMSLGARIRSRIEGATAAVQFGGRDKRRKGAA